MPAIIGTAGHIDHGKTALIRALTGFDTDRLKEEKERGISIDLGFAHLDLGDGSSAGIVDVPGHERFIRNMLAGAHGIDVVLLVVAADDGVMPQTEEHLEILHLLGVERGIAVITKADLVGPARLDEVREEIAVLLEGTRLAGSPAVAVSSPSGAGIPELELEIERQLARPAVRRQSGPFRMPIDRAFVMRGHGVVVTGTAISGILEEGASVRILPGGEACRVRGLQVHGGAVGAVVAGQRVALNLAGVEKTDVRRGHVLADPRFHRTTDRLDAAVEVRASAGRPLRNHALVRLHLGTASSLARVHVLDGRGEIRPQERGICQLVLEEQTAVLFGDRFVLRDETAQRTLGGGVVLQPLALRHRRQDGAAERLARLESAPDLTSRLRALLDCAGEPLVPLEWIEQVLPDGGEEIAAALRADADVVLLPDPGAPEAAATAAAVKDIERATLDHLQAAHRAAPLSPGVEMESVRSQVAPGLSPKLFRSLIERLEQSRALARDDSLLRLPSHQVALAAPERSLGHRAEELLAAAGLAPPDLRVLEASLAVPRRRLNDILAQLEREKRVVRVGPDLYFSAAAVEQAREILAGYLRARGEVTAAVFRDLISGSRKFSIALLDYFDRTGFTLRVGDLRKLRR